MKLKINKLKIRPKNRASLSKGGICHVSESVDIIHSGGINNTLYTPRKA
jgi:hypothetical protein